MRAATATAGPRPRAKARRPDEESDESIVPMKAVKAAGGKGLCSMARPQQGKERGDCGNATKLLSLASGPATGALPACQENQSFFKACNVNVEGSRMREIRTYGLTRGCWPVRLARRAGVYSTAMAYLRYE